MPNTIMEITPRISLLFKLFLDNFFADVGFETRYGGRRKQQWDLFIVAFKQAKTEDDAKKITLPFL